LKEKAMSKEEQIETLCKAVWEMCKQAPHDLSGEQHEFYLSRLTNCMLAAAQLFPAQFSAEVAKNWD
jgi:hypothetical protein